ncbi:MAG: exopolyphosphatase, partial [Rhizobiales bacterium]|nr:exopolyphosphatase [Hyphomicrobiales bacterium]
MDPDSGGKPPEGGASVAGRGEGRSSRRRKAKRRGKNLNAAPSVHGGTAQDAGQAGRPATDDALNPTRKRKRRRARSASAAKTEADGVTAVAVPARVPTAAGDTAGPGNPKKRRKKNRGGRGLQGRPLAQARAEPAYAPRAASPAGQAASVAMANGAGRIAPEAPRVYRDDFYAALDLGTNNCRLLIAQPTRPGQFRVVDAFSRIVRLGEGLAANRRLSNDAMDRAVDALKVCAAKLST